MNRYEFQRILQKYIDGRSSDEEKNLVDQWYELLDDESMPDISTDELNLIKYRSLVKCKDVPVKDLPTQKQVIPMYRYWKWVAVAVMAGIIVFSGYYWKSQTADVKQSHYFNSVTTVIEKRNTTRQPMQIILEDQSVVTLQPDAVLTYPEHFANIKREVYMQGEAFFQVTKNPDKPFYVFNSSIITHVLGTSFNVRFNLKNNTVQVDVHSGKVEVLENSLLVKNKPGGKVNGIILTPNQKVVYHETTRRFETSLLDKPVPLQPFTSNEAERKAFVFDEAPLSEILGSLERQYGIEIIVESDSLLNEPFTGDISRNDLFAKLEIICKTLKICYEVKETKILIRNNGCN